MDKMISTENWEITRYTGDDRGLWDSLVRASRNATFLHLRGYMDYHSDRFADASLIAYFRGKPMALLPANLARGNVLRSHGGLTYGGWILPEGHLDGADVLSLFQALKEYCRGAGIDRIDYSPVPTIYHRRPSQDDIYALFRMGATMTSCAISSTIDYADPGGFNTLMRRHLRKAEKLSPEIREQEDVTEFHRMLEQCLADRHDTAPVHTLGELQMLRDAFPDNIRVFTLSADGEMQAGICMYLTDTVAHAQYIATTAAGRGNNVLPYLVHHLIDLFSTTRRYFDFGTSCEEGGLVLNEGLLRQKSSFGASATVYQRFCISTN